MRRILVADDEENMCWVLSRALTILSFAVIDFTGLEPSEKQG